jgi:hypothetical protein
MSFVTHSQNKDASAFKAQVEETLAGKVVLVLEGLKAVVAQQFFNEEGGVSGGVSSVKKKPAPPAKGTVTLPGSKEAKSKEGGIGHSGRGDDTGPKSGEFKLPGQRTVKEGTTSGEKDQPALKVKKAVQQDKKPNLPTKTDFKKDGVSKLRNLRMKSFKQHISEKIGPVKKGQMHKDLHQSADHTETSADIAKEKAKGGVFAKRAVFAQNAKKWHHEEADLLDSITSACEEVLAFEESVEPIDELSKATLGRYVKSADKDMENRQYDSGTPKSIAKDNKRLNFIDKAKSKLNKEETILSEEMSDAAHELVLHADNSAQLHHGSHMPIINNLKKKMKKGVYDSEKAKKLWHYHADRAAQDYHKQYGHKSVPWHHMFSTADRKQAAAHWESYHRSELSEEVEQVNEAKPKVSPSWYANGGHRTPSDVVARFSAERKEKKQFAGAKKEIDRLKKQGK